MRESYDDFVNRIMNLHRFGKKKGVDIAGELLDALEHPEKGMKIIHVAGTNGKGSTCVYIADMLMKMGFKVGLFTSPHLIDYNERIQIAYDNTFTPISHEEVLQIGKEILDIDIEDEPTMFDICFIMAILKFRKENCDYIVLETGLGGLYDSTNAITCIPKVCVITSIGLEHTKYLGDTIEKIAKNKAGIFVKGAKIVLSKMDRTALQVMQSRCDELSIPESDIIYTDESDYSDYSYIKTQPGYQKINANAAISAVNALFDSDKDLFITKYMEYCKSKEEHCSNDCAKCANPYEQCAISLDEWNKLCINMGINAFSWPGRLEKIADNILIDGAHNEEAFTGLRKYIEDQYGSLDVTLIVGVLEDKEYIKGLSIISPVVDTFMTADINDKRAKSGIELVKELKECGIKAQYLGDEDAVAEFVCDLIQKNNAKLSVKLYNNLYVITGSLYFVGNVKRKIWQLQQG